MVASQQQLLSLPSSTSAFVNKATIVDPSSVTSSDVVVDVMVTRGVPTSSRTCFAWQPQKLVFGRPSNGRELVGTF